MVNKLFYKPNKLCDSENLCRESPIFKIPNELMSKILRNSISEYTNCSVHSLWNEIHFNEDIMSWSLLLRELKMNNFKNNHLHLATVIKIVRGNGFKFLTKKLLKEAKFLNISFTGSAMSLSQLLKLDKEIQQENYSRYKSVFEKSLKRFNCNPEFLHSYKDFQKAVKELPENQKKEISYLSFYGKAITRVPPVISEFPNLKIVQIKSNPIDFFPEFLQGSGIEVI